MRRIYYYLVVLLLLTSCEENNSIEIEYSYKWCKDYVLKSSYKVEGGTSFEVINNLDTLSNIVSATENINNHDIITQNDLKNNIALVVIKQFNSICSFTMNVDTIIFNNDTTKFYYTLNTNFGSDGNVCNRFAQPILLILSNKVDYSSVEFYENNNLIKKVSR